MTFFGNTAVHQPETAAVVIRLLSSGTERSKKTIIARIIDYVWGFHGHYEEDYGLSLMHRALELWNTIEVHEEIGGPLMEDAGIHIEPESREESLSDCYWRGNIAWNGVCMSASVRRGLTDLEFVRYAGSHRDIGTVIRTAIDRRTLDPDAIANVLNSQTTPLREGIL